MNMTLAIILAVCAVFGAPGVTASVVSAGLQQTDQAPDNKTQGDTTGQESKPQAPPKPSQPCEQSKDTCELSPEPQQPATTPAPATAPTQPESQPKSPEPAASPKKAPAHPKSKKARRKKKNSNPASGPRKVIVREGGTSEPNNQLSPAAPSQQTAAQTTNQLLEATQANLKTVSGRTLSQAQQATVDQIKMFVEQANSALKQGDLQRGHNLAMKAQLLSDDLVKH